jgi:hypothetical protein
MSNYRKSSSDIDVDIWVFLITVVLVMAFMFGFNSCTATKWNDGVCPNCNVEYELAGVYDSRRYYTCPTCHSEVSRYGQR